MVDTEWSRLSEAHERLKWARKQMFSTVRDAAAALGEKEGTYGAYERVPGQSSRAVHLDHQLAMRAGRKFRVSWTWLLTGEGTPFDRPYNDHQRKALEVLAELPEDRQEAVVKAILSLVEAA